MNANINNITTNLWKYICLLWLYIIPRLLIICICILYTFLHSYNCLYMVSHFTTYFAVTWSTDVHGHTVRGAMDAGPRNKLLSHANLRSRWDVPSVTNSTVEALDELRFPHRFPGCFPARIAASMRFLCWDTNLVGLHFILVSRLSYEALTTIRFLKGKARAQNIQQPACEIWAALDLETIQLGDVPSTSINISQPLNQQRTGHSGMVLGQLMDRSISLSIDSWRNRSLPIH